VDIGGPQAQPPDPASRAEPWIAGYQAEHPVESVGRDDAWPVQRAADVLVMDGAVHERDHPPETCCQPLWLEVAAEKLEQLLGAALRELVDTHLVGADDPALREALQQPQPAELFVADHVRDNVFDAPFGTQTGSFPLLRCQGRQELREFGAFG